MASQTQRICDCCHERPAVHHICYGRKGHTRHSCQICFEQFPSPEVLAFARHSSSAKRTTPLVTVR